MSASQAEGCEFDSRQELCINFLLLVPINETFPHIVASVKEMHTAHVYSVQAILLQNCSCWLLSVEAGGRCLADIH